MSRLTDEELKRLWQYHEVNSPNDEEDLSAWDVSDVYKLGQELLRVMRPMLAEVRERRTADLTTRDRELCDRALGIWTSDHNDAPHDEIAALRDRLLSQKAGG